MEQVLYYVDLLNDLCLMIKLDVNSSNGDGFGLLLGVLIDMD